MANDEELRKLTERVEFLEKEAMRRAPDQLMNEMILVVLWTWFFERNKDMNFDVLANALMRSVDDLPVPNASPDRADRIRAMLSASLDEFLATAREKVRIARERDSRSGR